MFFFQKFENPGTVQWDSIPKQSQQFCLSQSRPMGHGTQIPGTLGTGTKIVGTVPGFSALGLKSQGQKSLGLAVPSHAHPYFQRITYC